MTCLFELLRRMALAALILTCGLVLPGRAEQGERYIVIGGAVAEIFVALEADGEVVGVGGGIPLEGRFADVPVIRGFRLTSAENLLSLRPTKILIAGRQTTPGLIRQLDDVGMPVEVFDYTMTLDDVQARIMRLGDILNRRQEASKLAEKTAQEWGAVLADFADADARPKGLFVLSGGGRGNLAAGHDTLVAQLIQWAGGENLTTMIEGYKPLSQEAMAGFAPEFILTNMEGLEPAGNEVPLLSAPGIRLTPAYRHEALIAVPNGLLTEAGIRTPEAVRFLAGHMARLRAAQ
ncbi:ABC transporter substrate-binding protein [Roseovarius aestuarii]|nr:ABC transporter substrate-binding protein [Roseovarius aestuarii]